MLQFVLFFVVFIITIVSYRCQEHTLAYETFESDNNYPRPVSTHDHSILAMSGLKGGYLKKFNTNAEEIIGRKQMFEYKSNADIKEFLHPNEGIFLCVSSDEYQEHYKVLFNEEGVIKTIKGDKTSSFKIALTPLVNGMMLVNWVNDNVIYLSRQKLNDAKNDLIVDNYTTIETKNRFISCVEMIPGKQTTSAYVCMHISSTDCQEYYTVFDSDFSRTDHGVIESLFPNCGFDKIIKLKDNVTVPCYLNIRDLYCSLKEYDKSTGKINHLTGNMKMMHTCERDTQKVDTSAFNDHVFIGTCVNNITDQIQVVKVTVDYENKKLSPIVFQCAGPKGDYPFAAKFGENFLSVFYRSEGNNVYEIMEYPFCQKINLTVYQNSRSTIIDLSKYVRLGTGGTENAVLTVVFMEASQNIGNLRRASDHSEIKYSDGTSYVGHNIEDIYFQTFNVTEGIDIIKFAGRSSDFNRLGKWCILYVDVKPCYDGCYTCSAMGTPQNNLCNYSCENADINDRTCHYCLDNYYPIHDKTGSCEANKTGYYVDNSTGTGLWKPCGDTCATCLEGPETDKHHCKTCKSGYNQIYGDNGGNCEKDKEKDGYYVDQNDNLWKKCYESCETCKNGGTEESNNCDTCAHGNYKVENIDGQCSNSNTLPSDNYYFDNSGPIWKHCYPTCKTCDIGGNDNDHNCKECKDGYLPVQEKDQCLKDSPEGYYKGDTEHKKCDVACKNCYGAPLTGNTNCQECSSGYTPEYDLQTNCLQTKPDNYFEFTDSNGKKYYRKCYETCQKCLNTPGNSNIHQCITCITDHYKVEDRPTNCEKDPSGYYLDSSNPNTPIYKKCDEACLECTAKPDSTSTNCVVGKCNVEFGYFPVSDNPTNCLKFPPDHYYFDSNTKEHRPCHEKCLTCSGPKDTNSYNCLTCSDGYHPVSPIETTHDCWNSLEEEDYYLDTTTNPSRPEYKKCHERCATCIAGPTDLTHNCEECNKNFEGTATSKVENTKDCAYSNITDPYFDDKGGHYFLDTNADMWKECYPTCSQCHALGNVDDHQCEKCAEGHKFHYPTNNCVDKLPDHFYDKDDSDTYMPCHVSCDTCVGSAETDCTKCNYVGLYYPKIESVVNNAPQFECFSNTADIPKPPGDGYYLDKEPNVLEGVFKKCHEACQKCEGEGDNSNSNCLSCKTGYHPYEDLPSNCTNVDPPSHYFEDGKYKKCYPNCETCYQKGTAESMLCYTCLPGFARATDNGIFNDGKELVNCLISCDPGKHYWNGQCVVCKDIEPKGLITEDGNIFCVNCKDRGQYHIAPNSECTTSKPSSNMFPVNPDTNYYDKCDPKCKTCSGTASNCLTCADGTFLETIDGVIKCNDKCETGFVYEGKCDKCPDNLVGNIATRMCESCYPKFKHELRDECVDELPEGGFILDDKYPGDNVFNYCHPRCKSCYAIDGTDENMKCITCKQQYENKPNYLQRKPSSNCVESCGVGIVEDKVENKCINCKKDYTPPKYKEEGHKDSCKDEPPPNGYFWLDKTDKNYYDLCYETCETCTGIGEEDTHNCIKCKAGYFKEYDRSYPGYYTTNCVTECGPYLVMDSNRRECVNCADHGQYKYTSNTHCESFRPTDTVMPDKVGDDRDPTYPPEENIYNVIYDCYKSCAVCDALPETNTADQFLHYCQSCKAGYYLQEGGNITVGDHQYKIINNCEETCDEKYVADSKLRKCINCKTECTLASTCYKYLDQNYCLPSLPDNAYVDDRQPDHEDFNILTPCPVGCKKCELHSNGQPTCSSCEPGYFLEYMPDPTVGEERHCFSKREDCGMNLVADVTTNQCINCADSGKYKYPDSNTCINLPPQTYVTDTTYNIIADCYTLCNICSGAPNEDVPFHNCETCTPGHYLGYQEKNCYADCGDHLVDDYVNGKCVNCKDTNGFKHPNKNQCDTQRPPNSYIVDFTFNVYEYCYESCATCDAGYSEINSMHNCLTCKDGYHHQYNKVMNCVEDCGDDYGLDADNKCVNCKTYNPPKYKPFNEDNCVDVRPDNSYIVNAQTNTFKTCPSECATCSSDTVCHSCKEGYIHNPQFNQCVTKCDLSTQYWYVDDQGHYKCTDECRNIYPEDRQVLEPVQKQCVRNCNRDLRNSTCMQCVKDVLYEYNKQCVMECPAGYISNIETYTCDLLDVGEGCIDKVGATDKVSLEDIDRLSITSARDYMSNYFAGTDMHVDVISGEHYTLHVFKSDQCQYETSIKHGLSYVNFTECELKLLEHYSPNIEKGDIVFVKVDINRTEENTNQVAFTAFSQINGEELDISVCGELPIQYPLSNKIDLSLGETLDEWGYDIFDPNDDFYNNFCTPFYTKDGKDVAMVDRRASFFNNYTFCSEGCTYSKMNFKTAMVECNCDASSLSVANNTEIKENKPQAEFKSLSVSYNNLIVVRCYNLVFNWPYMKTNIGDWIMLAYIVFQIPGILNFIIVGLRPVYAYLNRFSTQKTLGNDVEVLANPPKQRHNPHQTTNENESAVDEEDIQDTTKNRGGQLDEESTTKKLPLYDVDNRNNYLYGSKQVVERRREVNVAKKPRKRTVKLEADYLEKGDSDGGEVEEEEEEEEEINEFENNEIDEMVYEDAVQYDKRKFTKVFSRNILQKMFFTGPFMSIHAIEPFFVRLLTFFLLLALYYALNGLFFSEAYISNTFASEGNNKVKFFIKHQLPMCILAAFIGAVVTALIMLFAFSRRRFMTVIEEEKDHESFLKRTHKVMRCLKIRLVIFVVLDVILMLAFWYYVSAFGAVYQKSQIPLLIGMVITVVFVLIFQIIYALLVTLMRYIGLKCKCLCLYTLSTYLL